MVLTKRRDILPSPTSTRPPQGELYSAMVRTQFPSAEGWCAEHAGMVSQFKIFTLIKTGHLPRSVILICHSNACTSIPNRTGTVHFDVLHRLRLIQHHAVRVRVQFLPHLHVSIPYDKYTTQK